MKQGDLVESKDMVGFKGILLCQVHEVSHKERQLGLFNWPQWKVLWFEHPFERAPYVEAIATNSLMIYNETDQN